MATTPIGLQRPPVPPPTVSGQQGAGPSGMMAPFANAAAQSPMASRPVPGAGTPAAPLSGGANPAGAFLALEQTMEKLLKQFGAMSETFQPYGDRALAIIQAGVAAVVQSMPQSGQAPAPDSSATGAEGGPPNPPTSAASGAGPNFPG